MFLVSSFYKDQTIVENAIQALAKMVYKSTYEDKLEPDCVEPPEEPEAGRSEARTLLESEFDLIDTEVLLGIKELSLFLSFMLSSLLLLLPLLSLSVSLSPFEAALTG